ncbi:MAG: hypothetical protein U1F67_05465 [Rubrivivax sp.]
MAATAATALPGCGFTLRLPPKLNFRSLALTGFEPRSSLAQELRRQIAAQVQVLDDANNRAEVIRRRWRTNARRASSPAPRRRRCAKCSCGCASSSASPRRAAAS